MILEKEEVSSCSLSMQVQIRSECRVCKLSANPGSDVGIAAPGYTERRVERIKDAYGIDVTQPAAAVYRPQQ